jgi:hypothetical protein
MSGREGKIYIINRRVNCNFKVAFKVLVWMDI